MDIQAETPLFIDPQQEDPARYIEYIGDKPRAIDGNEKGRITIEKTHRQAIFRRTTIFKHANGANTFYQSMTALRKVLQQSICPPGEQQQCETLLAKIQEELENAQKDEAEFALMIRCAIQHEFRY